MRRELLADERILRRGRRVDRHLPPGRARGDHRLGDRRPAAPRRGARSRPRGARAGSAARGRSRSRGSGSGRRPPRGSRERVVERRAARAAVAGVVGQERDLQLLRDQVLGEAERNAVVRRGDPEDVRPLLRVDEALVAVVDDAIGTCALSAIFHEASTPVPSLTIATACCAIARRMFATARLGEPALSDGHDPEVDDPGRHGHAQVRGPSRRRWRSSSRGTRRG